MKRFLIAFLVLLVLAIIFHVYKLIIVPRNDLFNTVEPSQLEEALTSGERVVLVDIREETDYNRGHINGAVNIPYSQFEKRFAELNPEDHIIIICYKGIRSKKAARLLTQNGYESVSHIKDGMSAWEGPLILK